MSKLNLSDESDMRRLAQPVQDILADWTTDEGWARLSRAEPDSPLAAGRSLVRALRVVTQSETIGLANRSSGELMELLALGAVGYVLTEAMCVEGYEDFVDRLRSLAGAGQFEQFYDTLFEAESAIYFKDEFRSPRVRLEPAAHPDIWVDIPRGAEPAAHPCECKRIEPKDRVQQQQDLLAGEIDKLLEASAHPPLKVLVHLHCPASEVAAQQIVAAVAALIQDLDVTSDKWLTASEAEGRFQVTVQALGELGEMKRRTASIDDVAAVGSLVTRVGTIFEASAQDPVAVRSLVRVRTDLLPNRIGAFERNLYKAVSQLEETTPGGGVGIVTIRLRPPRGLGDLYEADRIVRRLLTEQNATHVGFVMLAWNESEDTRRETNRPDERVRTVAYHLKPHFIANPIARLRFDSLDSASERFPGQSKGVIRDPETGELVPMDLSFLEDTDAGKDMVAGEESATLCTKLDRPYDGSQVGPFPRFLRLGERRLVLHFSPDCQMRFLEFQAGQLLRHATIDLRAWKGESELLFWIKWSEDALVASIPTPGETSRVDVVATSVRSVFI